MKTSHPPIRRMIHIDQQIRDGKYPNCNKIAREFEVNPKTIFRDIEYMRYQLDAPIEFDSKKNGYYYSRADYFLPAIHLSEGDILSFVVNDRILSQYINTPYYDEIKKVIEKILQFLPDDISTESMGNFVTFQQLPASPIERHKFEIIQKAIIEKVKIKIQYHSQHRNKMNERIVNPYHLYNNHGNWYLIGYCYWRQAERIFALNRILSIATINESSETPDDFSIDKFLKDSFNIISGGDTYHVKLKFSPYQARWIRERQWHHSQKLTELDDGGLILEMDVQGLEDVKRWVLRYGSEVEVIEPAILRDEIKKEIKELAKIYK